MRGSNVKSIYQSDAYRNKYIRVIASVGSLEITLIDEGELEYEHGIVNMLGSSL
jgi:hypothetical protein